MAAMSNEVAMDGPINAVGSWPPGTATQAFGEPNDMEFEQIVNDIRKDENEETAEMMRIYHQDQTPLSQRADLSSLWQFPNPGPVSVEIHKMHPIGKMFHKNYDIIKKLWRVDPQQVVPEEMRAQTPYSQALFLALRRLASSTKQKPEVAQEALLSVWRDRVGTPSGLAFDKSGMQFFQTQVGSHFNRTGKEHDNTLEAVVQETNYGLTLQDVLTAGTLGRKFTKDVKAGLSQPGGKLRGGDRAAQRADTRESRKQRKEQKAASREAELKQRQQDLNFVAGKGHASEYKVSKKKERKQASKMRDKMNSEKGYKLLEFLQADDDDTVVLNGNSAIHDALSGGNAAPPNSPEPNTAQLPGFSEQTMADATDHKKTRRSRNHGLSSDPAVAKYPTGQDRHNDSLLSQMFNRVDVDSDHKLSTKKEKRLLNLASQRQGSLPTDRVKLAELPALHTQQAPRREEEVLEKLGKIEVKMEEEGVRGNSVFADAPGGNQGVVGKSVFANGPAGKQGLIGKSVFANGSGGTQREVVVLSDDEEL